MPPPPPSSSSLLGDVAVDDTAAASATALRDANAKNLQTLEDAVTTLAGMKRLERPCRFAGENNRPDEGMLRNATSMIELRELADIRAFDEAMQAIAVASSKVANDDIIVADDEGNDNDNDDGRGFFIGDTDDAEDSPDWSTSFILQEQEVPLNDVESTDDGDDDDQYHPVFPAMKRSHSLAAIPDSSCSTTMRRSSFIPACASICEGDEQARRSSMERNKVAEGSVDAATKPTIDTTESSTTVPMTKDSAGASSNETIATANKSKRPSSATNTIKRSLSLLSLPSLGGRSTDGDEEKVDDVSTRRFRRGSFTKRSLKKSTSMTSLRGSRKCKNDEDELAYGLNSSFHSFSSNHDPHVKPIKSAMKRSVSLCAFNDSNGTLGTFDSSSSENPDPPKRNVSFHKLEIREYSVVLGDNPSCSSGPPVQLAWDPHHSDELKIDDYEEHRPPRRARAEMMMNHNVRWWRLMRESGYTVSHLKRATDACQEARKARLRTVRKVRRQAKINDTLTAPIRSFKKII
eukprot:CAMPEP_0181037732 /NCGR_PEP_ID=MMETSP1070-20121207/9561_1 /TAXON_ID=265543 /ORGANISM="Minutocellus polymorphus, Strain NH13" /LENGTH=518 /DNA_ID=CAMNT_0023115473 /DNA_START=576 /DNA_END=2132 /DNA_ORIENTATION=-